MQTVGGRRYPVVVDVSGQKMSAWRDHKLAVGAECQASFTDTREDRGNFEKSMVVGPSLQYRPFPQMTLNFAPLFGTTADSSDAQVWFNLGWEL